MPGAATNFRVVSRASSSALELGWNSAPEPDIPIQGYFITVRSDGEHEFKPIWDGGFAKTATSASLTALTPGFLYHFRLYSRIFNGNSTVFASLSTNACSAPSGLAKPALSLISRASVTVSWGEASSGDCPISSYSAWRDDGLGGAYVEINSASFTNKAHLRSAILTEFESAMVGRAINLFIRANNTVASTDSPIVSFTLADVPGAPTDTPNVVSISDKSGGAMSISVGYASPAPDDGGSPITGY